MVRLGRIVAALAVGGCGPTVAADEGAAETAGASATSTGTSSTGVSGTVGSTSAATTSTTQASTGEPDPSTSTTDISSSISLTAPDTFEPDGGEGPIECDQFLQNCPRGTKCMPWANDGGSDWNATRCSTVADDPRHAGEACAVVDSAVSGIDDCDGASMCWNVDPETLIGTCVPFCTGSEVAPVCANTCDACSIDGGGLPVLCLPGCDPLADDCARGEECVPLEGHFVCSPDASGDAGAIGEPCEYVNVCDPGLVCADADSVPDCADAVGCCVPFCDAAATDVCDALLTGTTCVPWYGEGMQPEGCTSSIVGACIVSP